MIEFVVFLITILFAIFLILAFLDSGLFVNAVLLVILYLLINRDLKNNDAHKYYIASLFLTAIIFILSNTQMVKYAFTLADIMLISAFTAAILLIYTIANLAGFLHEFFIYLKERH